MALVGLMSDKINTTTVYLEFEERANVLMILVIIIAVKFWNKSNQKVKKTTI
jgi:hypothetical protein